MTRLTRVTTTPIDIPTQISLLKDSQRLLRMRSIRLLTMFTEMNVSRNHPQLCITKFIPLLNYVLAFSVDRLIGIITSSITYDPKLI